jgi:hypothetical protein
MLELVPLVAQQDASAKPSAAENAKRYTVWNWGVLFTVLLLINPAFAQQGQTEGQRVKVLGCLSRGVEIGCLIIKDRVTGKTYQINAAKPAPDPARNRVIDLIGQTTSAVDFCQQGPVLSKISWHYTRRPCAAP